MGTGEGGDRLGGVCYPPPLYSPPPPPPFPMPNVCISPDRLKKNQIPVAPWSYTRSITVPITISCRTEDPPPLVTTSVLHPLLVVWCVVSCVSCHNMSCDAHVAAQQSIPEPLWHCVKVYLLWHCVKVYLWHCVKAAVSHPVHFATFSVVMIGHVTVSLEADCGRFFLIFQLRN